MDNKSTETKKKSLQLISSPEQLAFNEQIKEFTDREIQAKQTYYLSQVNKNIISIKNNVQFLFYFSIVLIALSIIIVFSQK